MFHNAGPDPIFSAEVSMSRYSNFILILLFIGAIFLFPCYQNAQSTWLKSYKGCNGIEPYYIQQTSDGGYIVAGQTLSFGVDYGDILILKLDGSGNILWQKTYGGSSWDSAGIIQQTTDGGYIVGGIIAIDVYAADEICVFKLDSIGNIKWQRRYGKDDGYSRFSFIQQTFDGGYIVGGKIHTFGEGHDDCWISKLDMSGNIIWQKTYAEYKGSDAYCIQQTTDGGYIVTGTIFVFGAGTFDCWVFKLDPSGNIMWQKTYGDHTSSSRGYSIKQTSDGGYILAGHNTGWNAVYGAQVYKLDPSGNLIWQKAYDEIVWNNLVVQQSNDGGYAILGDSLDYFWLLKIDPAGNIVWHKKFEGGWGTGAVSFQQTSDGGYVVAGDTYALNEEGHDELFVLKLDSSGNMDIPCTFVYDEEIAAADTFEPAATTSAIGEDSSATPNDIAAVTGQPFAEAATFCGNQVTISKIQKLSGPFRLKIFGSNYQNDTSVFIGNDASPYDNVKIKSDSLIVLGGGSSLKEKFPKGVPVQIKVVNGDGAYATYTYTR